MGKSYVESYSVEKLMLKKAKGIPIEEVESYKTTRDQREGFADL